MSDFEIIKDLPNEYVFRSRTGEAFRETAFLEVKAKFQALLGKGDINQEQYERALAAILPKK